MLINSNKSDIHFPSEEVLHRVTGFVVFIKSHNVTIEFKPWKLEEIPHRFELLPI